MALASGHHTLLTNEGGSLCWNQIWRIWGYPGQSQARLLSQSTALCTLCDRGAVQSHSCAHFHSEVAGGTSPLLKLPLTERCILYLFSTKTIIRQPWNLLFVVAQRSFSCLFADWPCSKRERGTPKPTRRLMTVCSRTDVWE